MVDSFLVYGYQALICQAILMNGPAKHQHLNIKLEISSVLYSHSRMILSIIL
jgi:hypothetical protein